MFWFPDPILHVTILGRMIAVILNLTSGRLWMIAFGASMISTHLFLTASRVRMISTQFCTTANRVRLTKVIAYMTAIRERLILVRLRTNAISTCMTSSRHYLTRGQPLRDRVILRLTLVNLYATVVL